MIIFDGDLGSFILAPFVVELFKLVQLQICYVTCTFEVTLDNVNVPVIELMCADVTLEFLVLGNAETVEIWFAFYQNFKLRYLVRFQSFNVSRHF